MNAPGNLVDGARRDWSFLAASEGQLTTLKWIGVAAMLVDHIGRYGFGLGLDSWAFALGRIAFPIFAGVLGLHLARYGADSAKTWRTVRRLAIWALVSMVPASMASGDWMPVNVFATLALGAGCCTASSVWTGGARVAAVSALLAAGTVVEFSVPGVALVWGVYRWSKSPTSRWTKLEVAGTAIVLILLNGAFGGPAAVVGSVTGGVFLAFAGALTSCVHRGKWAFYAVYPMHLALIAAVRQLGPL